MSLWVKLEENFWFACVTAILPQSPDHAYTHDHCAIDKGGHSQCRWWPHQGRVATLSQSLVIQSGLRTLRAILMYIAIRVCESKTMKVSTTVSKPNKNSIKRWRKWGRYIYKSFDEFCMLEKCAYYYTWMLGRERGEWFCMLAVCVSILQLKGAEEGKGYINLQSDLKGCQRRYATEWSSWKRCRENQVRMSRQSSQSRGPGRVVVGWGAGK